MEGFIKRNNNKIPIDSLIKVVAHTLLQGQLSFWDKFHLLHHFLLFYGRKNITYEKKQCLQAFYYALLYSPAQRMKKTEISYYQGKCHYCYNAGRVFYYEGTMAASGPISIEEPRTKPFRDRLRSLPGLVWLRTGTKAEKIHINAYSSRWKKSAL